MNDVKAKDDRNSQPGLLYRRTLQFVSQTNRREIILRYAKRNLLFLDAIVLKVLVYHLQELVASIALSFLLLSFASISPQPLIHRYGLILIWHF